MHVAYDRVDRPLKSGGASKKARKLRKEIHWIYAGNHRSLGRSSGVAEITIDYPAGGFRPSAEPPYTSRLAVEPPC